MFVSFTALVYPVRLILRADECRFAQIQKFMNRGKKSELQEITGLFELTSLGIGGTSITKSFC